MNFAFWNKHFHGKLPLFFRITEVGAFFPHCWSWNTLLKPIVQLRCRKSPLLSKFYILMPLQPEPITTLAIPGLSLAPAGATATMGSHAVPSTLPPAAAARESPRAMAAQAFPRSARPFYEKAACGNKHPEQHQRWLAAHVGMGHASSGPAGLREPPSTAGTCVCPHAGAQPAGNLVTCRSGGGTMGADTGVTTGLRAATPVSFKCHVYLEISPSNWERWNPVVQGVLRVTTEITSNVAKLCSEKLL